LYLIGLTIHTPAENDMKPNRDNNIKSVDPIKYGVKSFPMAKF